MGNVVKKYMTDDDDALYDKKKKKNRYGLVACDLVMVGKARDDLRQHKLLRS